MENKKDLKYGVAHMRSVVAFLSQWADDLEKSLEKENVAPAEDVEAETVDCVPEAAVEESSASEEAAVAIADVPAASVAAAPAAPSVPSAPALTLPKVRELLAEKCAAGFSAQVKALIESFGVSSLKDVPKEQYDALVAQVGLLGGTADA